MTYIGRGGCLDAVVDIVEVQDVQLEGLRDARAHKQARRAEQQRDC